MKNKKEFIITTCRYLLQIFYRLSAVVGIQNNNVSVLCYHGISEKKENRFVISYLDFINQINNIKKYSQFISVEKLLSVIDGKKPNKSSVLLTIDDGYKDVLTIISFIKQHNIPIILFVLSDPKNANRKELDHGGKLLSVAEIKDLHTLGWTIGCHSATHADFKNLSVKEIEKEVINSKKNLEKQLGFKIDYFAYPKGVYTKEIVSAVKKAGYKAGFAVGPGSISQRIDRLAIPRTVIDSSRKLWEFPSIYSRSTIYIRNLTDQFKLWERVVGI